MSEDHQANTVAASERAGPPWVHEGWREITDFLFTVAAFSLRPRRFTKEWLEGLRRAPNPLGFFATSLGVIAPLRVLLNSTH